ESKSLFPTLLKVAASIALVISVALVVFQLTKSEQLTLMATDTVITQQLSDGSVVTLKAGGELKYADGFADEVREVTLKGEAFFKVTPDSERPFVVHTQSIDVMVLGTSFNVKADDTNTADVVVVDGLVSVKYQDQAVKLNPGERAIAVLTSEKLTKQKNNDPNFLSWKTMNFSFVNIPLNQVVRDLSNAFNSTIQVDENMLNCPVTVSFQGQSLDSILRVLEATLNLTIKEDKGNKVLSGPGC
ncbi:MAG: FecR domain-containing protein, partial [Cyclobacteriaceae bacterium]|nr:FecR domain-containing protein [Cyclobacteriaceae bacterium SS2]